MFIPMWYFRIEMFQFIFMMWIIKLVIKKLCLIKELFRVKRSVGQSLVRRRVNPFKGFVPLHQLVHQLHFAFIYGQSWPLLRPSWKGKRGKGVKSVQITIQQISGNPARPHSMQPNLYQKKIFEEKNWRLCGEDLIQCEVPTAINWLSISLLLMSI